MISLSLSTRSSFIVRRSSNTANGLPTVTSLTGAAASPTTASVALSSRSTGDWVSRELWNRGYRSNWRINYASNVFHRSKSHGDWFVPYYASVRPHADLFQIGQSKALLTALWNIRINQKSQILSMVPNGLHLPNIIGIR